MMSYASADLVVEDKLLLLLPLLVVECANDLIFYVPPHGRDDGLLYGLADLSFMLNTGTAWKFQLIFQSAAERGL